MGSISKLFFVIIFLCFSISNAQNIDVEGKVIAPDDLEGIHIINKTASRFTITNSNGEFIIPAKLNDTIIISGIQYQPKEIIINASIVKSKSVTVFLQELVNQLDEVVVGKILTGDLLSDIENSEAERDINFYDLGIPGYTGKPLTQNERRLKEASDLNPTVGGSLGGGGVGLSLNPIINAISGRTKMLKNQVKLERQDECMSKIISNFSELLFNDSDLDEELRSEFFYFCSEDENFSNLCKINNHIAILEFLQEKLNVYKANLQIKKD
ncbi:hypothetical protein GCM10011531_08040 [Aquaticitalea lipolytica]|uniref:CarboxypepD_reg-like domain-containing protein n=1 Tax=Aquaticitalea lipolytica TaxID=1247562 RepID=A0A8J2TPP4_9FLAO|nr:carboxypeptidase-like regulatory domain-containing protein [Aquaticitalea lipolytica]GFZ80385.1 hypothetical protein GCM10011531_08040 [Aquaticitalea lipolytica]